MRRWSPMQPDDAETVDADSAAEQLLGSTRRTTALTLEAALSRLRPLKRDRRNRFADQWEDEGSDMVGVAFDMMALSRLSLRSAETLNGVIAGMVTAHRSTAPSHGARPEH